MFGLKEIVAMNAREATPKKPLPVVLTDAEHYSGDFSRIRFTGPYPCGWDLVEIVRVPSLILSDPNSDSEEHTRFREHLCALRNRASRNAMYGYGIVDRGPFTAYVGRFRKHEYGPKDSKAIVNPHLRD